MPIPTSVRPMRVAHVVARERRYFIHPDAGDEACSSFEPFPLRFPDPLLARALCVCEQLWDRFGRCLGLGMIVNCRTRAFGLHVPRQLCAADAASCNFTDELPGADPLIRLCGTIQTRHLASYENVFDAAPSSPGVHLILVLNRPTRELWGFYRPPTPALFTSAPAAETLSHAVQSIHCEDVIEIQDGLTLDEIMPRIDLI